LKATKPLREIKARDVHGIALNSVDLRAEMDAHGYVMIRGLLSPRDLNPLLGDFRRIAVLARKRQHLFGQIAAEV
jgi:hypothetical protein